MWKTIQQEIPSRELTYPPDKAYLKMIFLFSRWDMLISWRVYVFFDLQSIRGPWCICGWRWMSFGLRPEMPSCWMKDFASEKIGRSENLNTELNIEVKVDLKSETLSNDLPFWHRIPFLRKDVWIFVSEVFVDSFVFEVGLWHLLASKSNSFCYWWSTKKALYQEWHVAVTLWW